jgi:hypothetical protein
MPFIKLIPGSNTQTAQYSVQNADYYITNDNHADFEYPVDGWEYVENLPGDPEPDQLPAGLPNKVKKAFETLGTELHVRPTQVYKCAVDAQE